MNNEFQMCMSKIMNCMIAYADYVKSDYTNEELHDRYFKMYSELADKLVKKFN